MESLEAKIRLHELNQIEKRAVIQLIALLSEEELDYSQEIMELQQKLAGIEKEIEDLAKAIEGASHVINRN
jgi:hypothetical protein